MLARALAGLRKLWLAMFPVSLHSTRMRQLSVVWEVDKMPCMLKSVDWPARKIVQNVGPHENVVGVSCNP